MTRFRKLSVTAALSLVVGLLGTAPASASGGAAPDAPVAERASRTTIALKVKGCNGCMVQPIFVRHGQITPYRAKKVRDGKVRLRVPTARTRSMVFNVWAPWDRYTATHYPMFAVTRFAKKQPGQRIAWTSARKRSRASVCWAGTRRAKVRNTLVVKRIRKDGVRAGAAYFRKIWASKPPWQTVRKARPVYGDPANCP